MGKQKGSYCILTLLRNPALFSGMAVLMNMPDLHMKALEKATTKGISLNYFIKRAIEKELT